MQSNVCRTMPCDATNAKTYDRPKYRVIEGGLHRHEAKRSDVIAVIAMTIVSFVVFAGAWLITDHITEARMQAAFDATSYETITVVNGDSLWSIAEEHPVSGCTTQQVVDHIYETNDLESACLAAGAKITVPSTGR